jgi:hypothetical protein
MFHARIQRPGAALCPGAANPLPIPVGSRIGIILGTYEQSGGITPPLPKNP